MLKGKDVARIARTFRLEFGGLRARGAPAVILAVTGLVLAAGAVRTMASNAGIIPEVLREARGLATALRGERDSLPMSKA